jgi:hypothetical protein
MQSHHPHNAVQCNNSIASLRLAQLETIPPKPWFSSESQLSLASAVGFAG